MEVISLFIKHIFLLQFIKIQFSNNLTWVETVLVIIGKWPLLVLYKKIPRKLRYR